MAITASYSGNTGQSSTTIVLTKPSGTTDGDLLIAIIATEGQQTHTTPAGWALVQNAKNGTAATDENLSVFKRTASSEPSTTSFTVSGNNINGQGYMHRFTGATNPYVDQSTTNNGASGTTSTALSLTPTVANSLLVFITNNVKSGSSGTTTPPSGMTERGEGQFNTIDTEFADVVLSSTSSTGNKAATLSVAMTWGAVLLNISDQVDKTVTDVAPTATTVTGIAPTVTATSGVTVTQPSAPTTTLAGFAPVVGVITEVDPPVAGTTTLAGFAPTITTTASVTVTQLSASNVSIAGVTPTSVGTTQSVSISVPAAARIGILGIPIYRVSIGTPNNQVTDVGIVWQSYNGRGLITERANTRALARQSNGVLWAAVRENKPDAYINIYRSIDNGFSWQRVFAGTFNPSVSRKQGIANLNANGPFMQLLCYEKVDRLILIHAYFDTSLSQYNHEWFVFQMSTMTRLDAHASTPDVSVPPLNTVSVQSDELSFVAPYNESSIFVVWVKAGGLDINTYHPTYQHAESASASNGTHFVNVFDANVTTDGKVDVAIVFDNGANYLIQHVRYDDRSGTFTAGHTIFSVPAKPIIADMQIVRDNFGTMMCSWGQNNADGSDMDLYYSLSANSGVTWTAPQVVPKTAGQSVYIDPPTGNTDVTSAALGGVGGFLLSYTRQTSTGVPKTFVRSITTDDGLSYSLNDEAQIATTLAMDSDPVVGLRFFQPPGAKLLNLSEPGYIRVAYQVGQGNSAVQNDSQPVTFGQELLSQSAYPSILPTEAGVYFTDLPTLDCLQVNFNIIGAPNRNVDYYSLGFTGKVTQRYKAAFTRLGTDVKVLKYDPRITSQMNDRLSYRAPVEFTTRVFFESLTYDDPTDVNPGSDVWSQVIERDIRKIYFSPDFHMERTFVLNKGNYFKRTVWTIDWAGNTYEITQIVPQIIMDQIAFYEANAYVISPNRDPFRRRVLPSEI